MLSRAKMRAKKSGIEFTIVFDDLFIPQKCPVLGITLAIGDYDAAPSLDRISNERGYVPGNVLVVCNRANRLKNNGTPQEHLLIGRFYERLES
jgi:hypothetical protein